MTIILTILPRVPTLVFETDTNAGMGADREEKVMSDIGGNAVRLLAFWRRTFIHFEDLFPLFRR